MAQCEKMITPERQCKMNALVGNRFCWRHTISRIRMKRKKRKIVKKEYSMDHILTKVLTAFIESKIKSILKEMLTG